MEHLTLGRLGVAAGLPAPFVTIFRAKRPQNRIRPLFEGKTMLLRFRASNFRSIREEVELLLVASNLADQADAVMQTPLVNEGVLRVAAIYGANASGKTNVLRAMHFMRAAIHNSHRSWKPEAGVPREEFALDDESAEKGSLFEADFVLGDIRYRYGFEVDSQRILREWLHAYPTARRQTWFERSASEFTFGKYLGGENRVIRGLTRDNSLFLSAAAQNNHEQLLPLYRWFSAQWDFIKGDRDHLNILTAELAADEKYHSTIERLVVAADLGISGVETHDEEFDEKSKRLLSAFTSAMRDSGDTPPELPTTFKRVAFLHRCPSKPAVPLPLIDESDGTVAFFGLLGPVVRALRSGGILFIDELAANLHSLLALEIVRLFNSPRRNPHNAQLIFNTHDTTLLDPRVLRRDQVWFTEKDDCGATHVYPLTDFKPRRGENIKTGYLQGRYGAVPFVGTFGFDEDTHGSPRSE